MNRIFSLIILIFIFYPIYSSASENEIIKIKAIPKFELKEDPAIHLSDREGNLMSPIIKWLILEINEERSAIRIGRTWPSSSSILKDVALDEGLLKAAKEAGVKIREVKI